MPAASDRVPDDPLTESAAWRVLTRIVLFVLGLLLLGWVIVQLRTVVVQVVLAVILACGMAPLVESLTARPVFPGRRWRLPRAVVVLLLYVVLIAIVVGLVSAIFPPVVQEIEDLASRLPQYVSQLQEWLIELAARYPFLPLADVSDLSRALQALTGQLSAVLSQALVVFRVALGVVGWTFDAILTLILALYITSDSNRILRYLVTFLPRDRQPQAERVARHIGLRLGGWVRGQLLLSAIIGLLTLIGLTILGVRYATLLALVAAVGEAIPMVGPIFSAIPAVLIAFIYSPPLGFLTIGLYVLIQQLENHLIVPRVMSRAVELHPLAVILALLAGSELMGITGAILSVPVTAAISVVVDEVRRERLEHESARLRPEPVDDASAA